MSDGINPLPETVATNHRWYLVRNWTQFHRKGWRHDNAMNRTNFPYHCSFVPLIQSTKCRWCSSLLVLTNNIVTCDMRNLDAYVTSPSNGHISFTGMYFDIVNLKWQLYLPEPVYFVTKWSILSHHLIKATQEMTTAAFTATCLWYDHLTWGVAGYVENSCIRVLKRHTRTSNWCLYW